MQTNWKLVLDEEKLTSLIRDTHRYRRIFSHVDEREDCFVIYTKTNPIFCETSDYHPFFYFYKRRKI